MPRYILYPHRKSGETLLRRFDEIVIDSDATREKLTHILNTAETSEEIEIVSTAFEMLNIADELASRQLKEKYTLPGDMLREANLRISEWAEGKIKKEAA